MSGSEDAPGVPQQGSAVYEYWEAPGRYRISSRVPKDIALVQLTEVAFNGKVFQRFMQDSKMMTVSSWDSRFVPVALRNPLFLPLEFMNPTDDLHCIHCELRLSDLKPLAVLPGSANTASSLRDPGRHVVEGGIWDGVLTAYRVETAPEAPVARTIERQYSHGGRMMSRIETSDHKLVDKAAGLWFPQTLRLEILDPEAEKVMARFVYRIERIELNPEIDPAVFTLPWSMAENIWDEDRATMVHSAAAHRPTGGPRQGEKRDGKP